LNRWLGGLLLGCALSALLLLGRRLGYESHSVPGNQSDADHAYQNPQHNLGKNASPAYHA